ncbi:uncharacterized [Tachysurus ichikawai]
MEEMEEIMPESVIPGKSWRCMVIHQAVSGDYMERWLIEASHKRKISAKVQLPSSQGLLKDKGNQLRMLYSAHNARARL